MEKQAKYIRRIEIKGLWKRFNIAWVTVIEYPFRHQWGW